MFTYRTQVRLRDTDATGVLYFTEQFRMALETFEEFLKVNGFSLKALLGSQYLMPIVHAEGDYFAPLTVGDELEITMKVGQVGTTSLTLNFTLHDPNRQIDTGKVQIVHVMIDREKKASVPFPDFIFKIFNLKDSIYS